MKGILRGICTSEKKGTQKVQVPQAYLREGHGIEGDAHAGNWHRQVSLLALEKIEAFREKGADVDFGAFGENLIIEGFDLRALPVGTRFKVGEDALLELTQIGKECHSRCAIYHQVGDCIMPREGVFTIVLHSGTVKTGDTVEMIPADPDRPFTAAVITLSDKGYRGEREDTSGPAVVKILEENGLILTSGGTGFSERDVTPEATMHVATRNAPGIAEALRAGSMQITRRAMLSREVSVIRNQTLIVNLPGSTKAVIESLGFVIDQFDHGLKILTGRDGECGRH